MIQPLNYTINDFKNIMMYMRNYRILKRISSIGWSSTTSDKKKKVGNLPPLGSDKELKEGKGLKIVTSSKLVTRLPVLLAKLKAGNNSNKFENEIRQIVYLLYQHNEITRKPYRNLIKSL